MATVGEESSPSVPSLPTEILAHIASFLTPSLTRGWLPGSRGKQYKDLGRAAQLRWEIGAWTYTDMSPLFLPFLTNLASLAVLQEDDDYEYPLTIPKFLTDMVRPLRKLRSLQLDDFNSFADQTFDLGAELPELSSLALGSWWDHNSWKEIPPSTVDLHYTQDWEVYWEHSDERVIVQYLPFLKHLTLDSYLGVDRSSSHRPPRVVSDIDPFFAELIEEHPVETRASFPLESLVITKLVLFESEGLVELLHTLTSCAALRSLAFIDCSPQKTGHTATWRNLRMPHIESLTIAMRKPPSKPLPLQTLLGAFPNLTDLDISDVLNPRVNLNASLDTLARLPAEILMLLQFAREKSSIERLVVRFPARNEILRCWRVGDDEAEKGSYGFARELWRQW
ncbi:hypothetical protein BCR35DRAFT_332434 [Leucosporidium creatinivorum]|uniref:F-box domain-containing protein n=1 Tax=Leucosporidium creatinivorum TaxID=106004 RepID=A0A1Y2F537_9BASI|nr:hypothetical protein BCR35DRAFT_332434 [Leucosporidium creatinivorum]